MSAAADPTRLADEVLREIASRGVIRRFPAHTMLIHEGDTADTLFIVIDGRVKVFGSSDDGKEVILGFLGPGQYFGELALDGGRRDASVMTTGPTACAVVAGAVMREFLATHPAFAMHLIRTLVGRVRALSGEVKSLALRSAHDRIVGLLVQQSEPEHGRRVVRDPLTQQDIAERIGCSREMVSRVFRELRERGWLERREGAVWISNEPPPPV